MNKLSLYRSKYCDDIENVENYECARASGFKGFTLHHRLQTHFSDGTLRPFRCNITVNELKALGMYFNRPANEFIFLSRSEHQKLHSLVNNNFKPQYGNSYTKGKHHTDKTKHKMSESAKKTKHTDEWNAKISEKLKAYCKTISQDELRRRAILGGKATASKPLTEKQRNARKQNAFMIPNKDNCKGKHWYNDGVINKRFFEGEQPENFIPGRLTPWQGNTGGNKIG